MSRAAELLRAVAGRRWVDEDGNANRFELLPPLTPDEIASLEGDLGFALPAEARALLSVARGLAQSPLESVDFAGLGGGAVLEEIFPHAVSIAHDGFGNYWVVDASPNSDVWTSTATARRHRLLVHRHKLQPTMLLRPPSLLPRAYDCYKSLTITL